MNKLNKIIVSDTSYHDDDPYEVIYSNIMVINFLGEERIEVHQVHEDSMISYNLDYYLDQYNNGNFSQFVWNSKWSKELNDDIKNGLAKIGAEKHLKLFLEQSEKVEKLSAPELQNFLQSDYFGENPVRDSLKNDAFYDLGEDLITLNANWLKKHPDLQVLSIDDIYNTLEDFIGREINRE